MKGGSVIVALYILLGIALLICLILSLRISIKIVYKDELKVHLRFLFFKTDLLSESASSKIDFNKFIQKMDTKPQNEGETDEIEEPSSPSILSKLESIRQILSLLFNTFRQHLHVKLTKIDIKVATGDAAKTAILYGTVSTAVACIVDIMDEITNLRKLKSSSISVEPDFLSDKSDIKLNILLSISILGIIKVFMKSFIKYFSLNDNSKNNNRKEK